MEQSKSSSEVLSEIYRNAQLALESISDIMPEIESSPMREEISRQHEEYERISAKAVLLAKQRGQELLEPGAFKKAMMWGGIKMNTLTDNSVQHIAEMMIKGTVMGITSLRQSATDNEDLQDEEVTALLKELLALEEDFEQRLKKFL